MHRRARRSAQPLEVVSCALCQESRELCRSHIIPDFLYRTMRDEKNRFNVLSATDDQRDRVVQAGLWERLLCTDCETKLSLWERYGSLVLGGGIALDYRRSGDF